jgi:rubrerythrin
MSDHEPSVPEWTCRECGADWPCVTRRGEISDAFADQYTSMVMYLAYTMLQAAEDLRHIPAGWLHNRFVGWTNDPDDPAPFTSVDILINGYKLANDHSPDADGKCPVCGDPADCWVRINPDGPGFLIPVP